VPQQSGQLLVWLDVLNAITVSLEARVPEADGRLLSELVVEIEIESLEVGTVQSRCGRLCLPLQQLCRVIVISIHARFWLRDRTRSGYVTSYCRYDNVHSGDCLLGRDFQY